MIMQRPGGLLVYKYPVYLKSMPTDDIYFQHNFLNVFLLPFLVPERLHIFYLSRRYLHIQVDNTGNCRIDFRYAGMVFNQNLLFRH